MQERRSPQRIVVGPFRNAYGDPRSGSAVSKTLRLAFSIVLSFFALEGLKRSFAMVASDYSIAGYLLQYVRYIMVATASLFIAPWIFTRCNLAAPKLRHPRAPLR